MVDTSPSGNAYLELGGIIDPMASQEIKSLLRNVLTTGDHFFGLFLRVDTEEELETVAKRNKLTISLPGTGERIRSSGPPLHARSAGSIETSFKGRPCFVYWPDMSNHPSGQPPLPAPGLVDPLGIAWVEWGGTEADMADWLGGPTPNLPFRFNGKPQGGLHAVGLTTDKGEIVVRRKAYYED